MLILLFGICNEHMLMVAKRLSVIIFLNNSIFLTFVRGFKILLAQLKKAYKFLV